MTDTAMRHPRALTALTIVRDRSEFSHRSAIRGVAMLHVVRDRERGARFSLDHNAFDRETSRAEIIEGIAERIPQDATLIARAPRIRPDKIHWDHTRQHCEADVLFTAMALVAWLRLQGTSFLRIPGAQLALLEAFLRSRPNAIRAPLLRRLADELQQTVIGDFDQAA